MSRQGRLFVLWVEPTVRRWVVGELWQTARGFCFGYRTDLLAEAEAAGFHLLAEFPEPKSIAEPYASPYLFRTFQQRIPAPTRPDYAAILDSWGVEDRDDPMDVLAKSGGILLTDRIELSEYKSSSDDLSRPLVFRLSGESHYQQAAGDLSTGMLLGLRRQPENPADPYATVVLIAADGRQVGWVPRPYSELVARHLDRGAALEARVLRRLILPEERGRWVVQLARKNSTKVGFASP